MYPIVPGHELVGTVVEVGSSVSRVAVGDNVAVGCIKDSCMDCKSCHSGDENYCAKGFTHTYNSPKSPVRLIVNRGTGHDLKRAPDFLNMF